MSPWCPVFTGLPRVLAISGFDWSVMSIGSGGLRIGPSCLLVLVVLWFYHASCLLTSGLTQLADQVHRPVVAAVGRVQVHQELDVEPSNLSLKDVWDGLTLVFLVLPLPPGEVWRPKNKYQNHNRSAAASNQFIPSPWTRTSLRFPGSLWVLNPPRRT